MEHKHTAGPWYADQRGNIWRRDPSELYENGGAVAGDKPVATAHGGWYGENAIGYPIEANARLIASAPELLEALVLAERFMCGFEGDPMQVEIEGSLRQMRTAIAKATGEQE